MFTFENYKFDDLGYVRLPKVHFSLEERRKLGLDESATNSQILKALTNNGLKEKIKNKQIPEKDIAEYVSRCKFELETFDELHFTDYILLVHKIVQKAVVDLGEFYDWGRGSVCGSLIAWLLGFSGFDPIPKHLFFSRFVSKFRAKSKIINGQVYLQNDLIADIDLNLGSVRDKIIDWLNEVYPNRICKILTVGTLTGKVLIKEVAKCVDGASESESQEIADKIERRFGVVEDIAKVYDRSESFKKWADEHPKSYRIALKLRELIHQYGVHASGYLICYDEIKDTLPAQLDSKKSIVASYTMNYVPAIKVDLLGLITNSIIKGILTNIPEKVGDINLEDNPDIYNRLQEDYLPYGLYQINAPTAQKVCKKVKPKNIIELSDVNALARPGAIEWIDNYTNPETKSPHQIFDKIFSWTHNTPLYQEQLMQMAVAIGFTNDEAEMIRRCVTNDTMFVSKSRGWVTIETLMRDGYKDDLFLVMDELGNKQWKKIQNIWSTGMHQTTTVESLNGLSVRATQYHQFLTDNGWIARRKLSKKDYLICPKSVEWDGNDSITPELAYVIMGVVCEGYFTKEFYSHFTAWDKDVMDEFVGYYEKVFNKKPTFHQDSYKVAFINKAEKVLLNQHLSYGKSASKFLPEKLMGMTKETTRKLLSLFFCYEGGLIIRKRENNSVDYIVSGSSASRRLIHQIQLLLLRFGIYSNVYKKYNKKYKRYYWHLDISNQTEILKFKNEIGFGVSREKQDLLTTVNYDNPTTLNDLVPNSITQKLINQYPFAPHNADLASGHTYKHNIGRSQFSLLADNTNDNYWKKLSRGEQMYIRFCNQKESTRVVETFDFTVDEDTPYIVANGMVIHNCVAKKKHDEVQQWEARVNAKIKENNLPEEVGRIFWKVLEDSSSYSFNLSHSLAVSYLGALTVYLKYKYPTQFYYACLKATKDQAEISQIQKEMEVFGIKLLPPNLLKSDLDSRIEDGNIRYGLGSIKGVAEKSFQNLLTFRKPYSNKFELFESAKQSKLSVGITSSMIMAGALNDFLVQSRSRLVLEAQLWNLLTPKEKVLALQYGPQFNFDLLLVLKYLSESPNEKGKMLIKESRFQTIRNHYEPYKQIYLLNSRNEEFANWFYERKLLGYSYSSTLYDIFSKFLSNLIPLSAAMNLEEKDSLQTIAIVKEGKKTKSKAGKEYIKYEIEDESASTTLLLFGDDKIGKHLLDNEGLVEEEDIVLVTGNKGRDCIFGTKVVKQSNKIYMKLSELKENNAKI